jgi:hypothetical protein
MLPEETETAALFFCRCSVRFFGAAAYTKRREEFPLLKKRSRIFDFEKTLG